MFTYSQASGSLEHNGALIGCGYSGAGLGRNNPAMQSMHNIGPIPQGGYIIGQPYADPHKGRLVMKLIPNGSNRMFGRTGFLIHGDNATHDASHGCIILDHATRQAVANLLGNDNALRVVEDHQ